MYLFHLISIDLQSSRSFNTHAAKLTVLITLTVNIISASVYAINARIRVLSLATVQFVLRLLIKSNPIGLNWDAQFLC
jgi:hypothetical protein